MLGNIVVITVASFFILDMLLMAVYCRFMDRLDRRRAKKNEELQRGEQKITPVAAAPKKSFLKRFASFLIDHFIYGLMRYSVVVVGKIPSGHIRNILYRYVFNMKITRKTVIYGGAEIRSPWNLHADNCVIQNNALLDCRQPITIGQNVVFGVGVHIWTEEHDVNSPTFQVTPAHRAGVTIEDRAWICSDSTILPGVHVGKGSVLASRACATKDLESFGIYAGIPAKKIGERNHDLVYELTGKTHWHFY